MDHQTEQIILDGLMDVEDIDDHDLLRNLLKARVLVLQGMYNVYSYIRHPFLVQQELSEVDLSVET